MLRVIAVFALAALAGCQHVPVVAGKDRDGSSRPGRGFVVIESPCQMPGCNDSFGYSPAPQPARLPRN